MTRYFQYRVEQISSYGIDNFYFVTRFKILALIYYYLSVKFDGTSYTYLIYADYYGKNFPEMVLSKQIRPKK